MIKAVIFDMDGVLIDSEPIWRQAEIAVFAGVGVILTERDCEKTMGLRIDEVVAHWYKLHPWEGKSQQILQNEILEQVERLILQQGKPLPGLLHSIQIFRSLGLPLAIASSSPRRLIQAVLTRFGLINFFSIVHSAEDEDYGKPHPAVYLTTAKKVGIAPERCLAIEDSVNGMRSALAAGMKTIVIPEQFNAADERFGEANLKLASLTDINEGYIGSFL